MNIELWEGQDAALFDGLLGADGLRRAHRFLAREATPELVSYRRQELIDLSAEGSVLLAREGEELSGLICVQPRPWDTRVLGPVTAEIKWLALARPEPELANLLTRRATEFASSELGAEFVVCMPRTDDTIWTHALQAAGYGLMDTILDYVYSYQRRPLAELEEPRLAAGYAIRQARVEDEGQLRELAKSCFGQHFGRFNADPELGADAALGVYQEWVSSSLAGYADWFFVADRDGELAGYTIWRRPTTNEQDLLEAKVGHYSIGAVSPNHSGQGLFMALTHAGMQQLEGVADVIIGPTHVNNYPVQRGYNRLAWYIGDAHHSFHRWERSS